MEKLNIVFTLLDDTVIWQAKEKEHFKFKIVSVF